MHLPKFDKPPEAARTAQVARAAHQTQPAAGRLSLHFLSQRDLDMAGDQVLQAVVLAAAGLYNVRAPPREAPNASCTGL